MHTRFIKKTALALLCMGSGVVSAEQININFSDSQCFGLAQDRVQINNIRVDTLVANPFDPNRPTVYSATYDVPFRFDAQSLHLIPDLGGAQLDSADRNCAALKVLITNAVNGQPLPQAAVSVNDHAQMTQTDGFAVLSGLPSGQTQVNVAIAGYESASRTVELVCPQANQLSIPLNPTGGVQRLETGEVRVVLSWRENPVDLDAHLTGPQPGLPGSDENEPGRFHIYWYSPDKSDVAILDVDDRESFGPETVTISPPTGQMTLRPGIYRYSVHHYEGTGFITDGATVELFIGNERRVFTAPSASRLAGASYSEGNQMIAGDAWTVFELNVDQNGHVSVLPVNSYLQTFAEEVRAGQRSASGYGSIENPALFGAVK